MIQPPPPASFHPHTTPSHSRFAAIPGIVRAPFSVNFEKNQVLNRLVVEVGGWFPADMIMARNAHERRERKMDHGLWLAMGIGFPVLLERLLNRKAIRDLQQQFKLPTAPTALLPKHAGAGDRMMAFLQGDGKRSPLQIPLEWLSKNPAKKPTAKLVEPIAHNLGMTTKHLTQLLENPTFQKAVLNRKLGIMAADLAFMAANAQLFLWGKNLVTAKKSGKTGFSGIYDYASPEYLEKESASFQKHWKRRFAASLALSTASVVGLPLALRGILRSPSQAAKALQPVVKAFNYTDAVYMSRWVYLWFNALNYLAGGVLAARGSDEARENVVRNMSSNVVYLAGDSILGSMGATMLMKSTKDKLGGVSLFKPGKKLASLEHVLAQAGGKTTHPAYSLARQNFWGALLLSTALLGLTVPAMSMAYTKRRVLEKLNKLQPEPKVQTEPTPTGDDSRLKFSAFSAYEPAVTPLMKQLNARFAKLNSSLSPIQPDHAYRKWAGYQPAPYRFGASTAWQTYYPFTDKPVREGLLALPVLKFSAMHPNHPTPDPT